MSAHRRQPCRRRPGCRFLAKLAALVGLQALLLLVVLAVRRRRSSSCSGYTKLELGPVPLRALRAAAARLRADVRAGARRATVVNHKYLGHFVVVLYYLVHAVPAALRLRAPLLYRYGEPPRVIYSDMNGYGHFLRGRVLWFQLYWAACAVLLAGAGARSSGCAAPTRLDAALAHRAARLHAPRSSPAPRRRRCSSATGALIYYNTHVLNAYRTRVEHEEPMRAEYEKRYKPLRARAAAQDHRGAHRDVDIYPAEHAAARAPAATRCGTRAAQPIAERLRHLSRARSTVRKLAGSVAAEARRIAQELGWHHYRARAPLAPGAAHGARLRSRVPAARASATRAPTRPWSTTAPSSTTGCCRARLPATAPSWSDDRDRKKHGLAPKERMADLRRRGRAPATTTSPATPTGSTSTPP